MRTARILLFALCVQASAFAAAPKSSPADYYVDFVEAGEMLGGQKYEPARAILDRLVHIFPDDSSTWTSYAIALTGLHRDEEAIVRRSRASPAAARSGSGDRRRARGDSRFLDAKTAEWRALNPQ